MILDVHTPDEVNMNFKSMLDYCKGRIYLILLLKHIFLNNIFICNLKESRLWVYVVPNHELMRIIQSYLSLLNA